MLENDDVSENQSNLFQLSKKTLKQIHTSKLYLCVSINKVEARLTRRVAAGAAAVGKESCRERPRPISISLSIYYADSPTSSVFKY